MREPFPLQWPDGWRRTSPEDRKHSRFLLGFSAALRSLIVEFERIGAVNAVITSDLPVRRDGLPYADGSRRGRDPGIAVWFHLGGQERVWASDRWATPEENLRAIALSIEALRGLERWGVGDVITRAFAGFNALPPGDPPPNPNPSAPDWRVIFGRDLAEAYDSGKCDRDTLMLQIQRRYRDAMRLAHPDVGGHNDDAIVLNLALQAAKREIARGRA